MLQTSMRFMTSKRMERIKKQQRKQGNKKTTLKGGFFVGYTYIFCWNILRPHVYMLALFVLVLCMTYGQCVSFWYTHYIEHNT